MWVLRHHGQGSGSPNNSLQLTRLACGKLERALPVRLRENEWTVARAAGQLPVKNTGQVARGR
jgi:hypothetical protein